MNQQTMPWSTGEQHTSAKALEFDCIVECMRHLLMGFELSLYEPADYAMVYW